MNKNTRNNLNNYKNPFSVKGRKKDAFNGIINHVNNVRL